MKTLYAVIGGYERGDVVEAIFFARCDACRWVCDENDKLEAELYWVEEIPLIDRYGYPCEPQDLPLVSSWASEPSIVEGA